MRIEKRVTAGAVEVREDGQTTIRGYAALYDTEAVIGGLFRERIAQGAFRSVLATNPDVRALFNHSDDIVLGRTAAGTLTVWEDERGLGYEFTPNPMDTDAMNVVARIRRGDVNQSSYGFAVAPDGQEWKRATSDSELPLRTITKFDVLRDVSPVTFPAFADTTAEARSALDDSRAAVPMPLDEAEETAEVIQFQALADALDQITALAEKAKPIVQQLIAENGPADDSEDAEAAEESVEKARYAALCALVAQLNGAAWGVQGLIENLRWSGGFYAAQHEKTRAEIDLLALEV